MGRSRAGCSSGNPLLECGSTVSCPTFRRHREIVSFNSQDSYAPVHGFVHGWDEGSSASLSSATNRDETPR
eukprot:2177068-Amphidinium_carterae.1